MEFENATFAAIARAVRENTARMRAQNDLDESQRPVADYTEEVDEFGEFTEAGATLSCADFEDARVNL